jgi:hypothetical protein
MAIHYRELRALIISGCTISLSLVFVNVASPKPISKVPRVDNTSAIAHPSEATRKKASGPLKKRLSKSVSTKVLNSNKRQLSHQNSQAPSTSNEYRKEVDSFVNGKSNVLRGWDAGG